MKKSETLKLLEKISGTYPNQFFTTDDVKNTWCEMLEPYDLKDVERKFEEYIMSDYDRPPQLPNLIKYLKTQEQKRNETKGYSIYCDLCGRPMEMTYYEEQHRDKCLLIQAVIKKAKQQGRLITYEELNKMSYGELNRRFGKLFEEKEDFLKNIKKIQ